MPVLPSLKVLKQSRTLYLTDIKGQLWRSPVGIGVDIEYYSTWRDGDLFAIGEGTWKDGEAIDAARRGLHTMFIKSSRTTSGLQYYYHLGHRSLVNQELSHFINVLAEATELRVDGIFKI